MLYPRRPHHSRLNHDRPIWRSDEDIYFITISCEKRGYNQLCKPHTAGKLLKSTAFYHENNTWSCHIMLLMPDHLHALIRFPIENSMAKTIGSWKRYTARQYNIQWQREFFDHRIRNEDYLIQQWDYILNNPVAAGLADNSEQWPFIWIPSRQQ